MARPKKIKKTATEEPKVTEIQENQAMEGSESQVDDPLAGKNLLRIDEAATYFGISTDCVKLWIDHGHLQKENMLGPIRISRASILGCRFRRYFGTPNNE